MKVIIIISGFTQQMHQHTGSRQLWREMRLLDDLCATKDVVVELKKWNTDWKDYAKYINSLNAPEVFICAYSWGGGYGLPKLSKRLDGAVRAVVCDPLYYSPTILGRWKALFDKWAIRLPKNVSVVRWLAQSGDVLDGDPLKGGKSICEVELLNYKHTEIDNSKEYHKAAIQEATNYLRDI